MLGLLEVSEGQLVQVLVGASSSRLIAHPQLVPVRD